MTIILQKIISKIYLVFLKVNKGDNIKSIHLTMISAYEDWKSLKLVFFITLIHTPKIFTSFKQTLKILNMITTISKINIFI